MPAAKDGGRTPVKVKRKQGGSSVGQAISKAGKGKDVSFGPKVKPAPKPRSAAPLMTGKPRSSNAGVGAKSKGTVKLKKKSGIERNLGAAAHLLFPRGSKENPKGTGRLGAVGGNQLDIANSAPGIVARSTAVEFAKDPKRATADTGKAIVSIPAGLIRAAGDPKGAANAIAKDYPHRYGAALQGDYKKFNERQKKEGIVGEVFDASMLASAGGSVTGRVLQKAAEAGKLGSGAKVVATRTTRLRVSGGAEGVKVRKPSKNYWKNAAQARLDRSRAKKQAKRAAKPTAPGIVREAEANNAAAGKVVEVTPKTKRAVKRAQKREVANRGGITLQTMKAEQAREVHSTRTGVAASTKKLTKDERDAYKYQAQYGPKTPEAARAILVKHRARVVAERAANPDVKPIVDELPVIDKLIAKAEGAFTPRLRAAVKTEGNRSRRLAAKDPGLGDGQALRRAHMPAADLLGIKPIGETVRPGRVRSVRVGERTIVKEGAAPDSGPFKYDPSPEAINKRTQYHGSGTPDLTADAIDTAGTNHASLFGQGFYTTDARNISKGYMSARARDKGGHLYEARLNVKRPLDLEGKPDPRFTEALATRLENLAGIGDKEAAANLRNFANRAKSNDAVYKQFREYVADFSHGEMIPTSELVYDFQVLADELRKTWDSMVHIGGKRTGNNPHHVVIVLDRKAIQRLGPAGAEAPPPKAKLRVTQHQPVREPDVKVPAETAVQFARRVRQEGHKQGLGAPAYFKSEEIPKGVHAAFAKGGQRAVAEDRAYTGALTRTGRESGDLEIVSRSAAQNIKRRYNWNHVADTVDAHTYPWSKEKPHTAYELERQIRERGIDPSTVALWNPRLMRKAQEGVAEAEGGASLDPTLESATIESALRSATADVADLKTRRTDFEQAGWQVVDKNALDEVMSTTHSEGAVGRGYDITKGQISRVLLANPAWLGFQVASNGLMSGLAGVTPRDFVRAQQFFKKMSPEDKAAAEAIFGVHGWYKEQRRMGAAGGHWTAGWNALKETPFYRRALEGKSPLDALFFRPDNAQNNAFRRALMYSRLKRQAYRELGQNASTIVRTQNRITGILKGNPEEQMLALAKNKKVVEEHAQAVDDFLGNWTRYTAKERRGWSRFVMFYGFLRFATRLAFYTMPVKHPIMSSILLQIGRLEKDEIERIFGTEPPPWEYGNLYAPTASWGENPTREQTNMRVPTTRLVPFFNALQYGNPGAPIGMLNPGVGMALNQVAGKNITLDQPYTVDGSTAYVQHSGDLGSLFPPSANRLEIMLGEALRLSPYYRAAEAVKLRGKQSSDSSLLFPQPVQYSTKGRGPEAKARNDKRIAEQNARGVFGALQETLAPQIGTGGNARIDSARSFAQSKGKKPKKVKVKKSTNEFLSGGSTRNEFLP